MTKDFTLDRVIPVAVAGAIVGTFLALVLTLARQNQLTETCLKNGYPQMIYVNWTAYCVRRVGDTDQVAPLSALSK